MPRLPIPTIRPWQQHHCNRSTTASTVALASTAATSATGTTLVNNSATWATNQYRNFWVTILTGTGAGQTRNITSNNGTTLTVPTWTVTPDNTSTFQIVQPIYPGLQGSLVPGSTGGAVLANVTYREVFPTAGAAEVTARLKTTTAAGTLTITPIRLLAATDPSDEAIFSGGSIDTTKVQKYGTGGSSATAVVAGTELALTINPSGEAYCMLEFACTTAGTLNYCDVMTLQAPGNVTSSGGTGANDVLTDAHDATNHAVQVTIVADTQAAPANPPAFQLELNDGTPVGDTAAHGMFVKTGGNIADGSAATGSLASLVGGVDNAGTPVVRTMQVVPMNASPNQASTFGVLTFSAMTCLSSGFQNPVKSIGAIGSGTTGLFAASAGLVGFNGTTYDVIPGDATNGLRVNAGSGTFNNVPTVAVTASAYAANQCMGGKWTLTNLLRVGGPLTGTLAKLTLRWHGTTPPALSILVFKDNPAATFTDQSTFPTLSAADNALMTAIINVATTDWTVVGGSAFCTKITGGMPISGVAATLYAAANVTSGTPTPAATTDLSLSFAGYAD